MDTQVQAETEVKNPSTRLTCVKCGGQFEAALSNPRLRCPHCAAIGYADRAGRNLLPVGWDCAECGHHNNGLTNFCVECGAGLASRCLHCEAPVYTAVCQTCGSHQARLMRLQALKAERAEWVPILQSYLPPVQPPPAPAPAVQQAAPQVVSEAAAPPQQSWVTEWTAVDQHMQQAAQRRSTRHAQRRAQRAGRSSRRRSGWRWWWNPWTFFGLLWLLNNAWQEIRNAMDTANVPEVAQSLLSSASQSLVNFNPSPSQFMLLITATFGVAALSILLYLLYRAARRLLNF